MTVAEIIEALSKLPPEAEVYAYDYSSATMGVVDLVELSKHPTKDGRPRVDISP